MTKTYVAKRFRTFRKPITRKFAKGGIIRGPGTYIVGTGDPEMFIPTTGTVTTHGTLANLIFTTTKHTT